MKLKLAYKLKRKDVISVGIMVIIVLLLFLARGVDYQPGITETCSNCAKDIGVMDREGHFEEMLWNGVRHVHNSANDNLIQFTQANSFQPTKDNTIQNCIDCHNDTPDAQADSMGKFG